MSGWIDLHTHSTYSDGKLSPVELVEYMKGVGVTTLALTDHDSTEGLEEARLACGQEIQLISGTEISGCWKGKTIHILGLGFNQTNQTLQTLLASNRSIRWERAKLIAKKLTDLGVPGAIKYLEDWHITNPGRLHFARFLQKVRVVKTYGEAFTQYLGNGQCAYVPVSWPSFSTIISAIHAAKGQAVLAHPMHYRYELLQLNQLIKAFAELGGDGIEIVSPKITHDQFKLIGQLARKYSLRVSVGSDFHFPTNKGRERLLKYSGRAREYAPVWSMWERQ
jgi:hypothetical protein